MIEVIPNQTYARSLTETGASIRYYVSEHDRTLSLFSLFILSLSCECFFLSIVCKFQLLLIDNLGGSYVTSYSYQLF